MLNSNGMRRSKFLITGSLHIEAGHRFSWCISWVYFTAQFYFAVLFYRQPGELKVEKG